MWRHPTSENLKNTPTLGHSQAHPPLDIVRVTSFALRKIEKHPHSWTFTKGGGPTLGPMLKSLHRGPKGGGGPDPLDPPPLDPPLIRPTYMHVCMLLCMLYIGLHTYVWIDRWMDGWMDGGWIGGWVVDGWVDGRMWIYKPIRVRPCCLYCKHTPRVYRSASYTSLYPSFCSLVVPTWTFTRSYNRTLKTVDV